MFGSTKVRNRMKSQVEREIEYELNQMKLQQIKMNLNDEVYMNKATERVADKLLSFMI